MITAGIDIGSRNTKLVLWDIKQEKIIFNSMVKTGTAPQQAAENLLERAAKAIDKKSNIFLENGSKNDLPLFATGYGRKLLQVDYVSEISCHTRGIRQMLPDTRTVIDIGGQDSKAVSLDEEGNILEFAMNDKCAAGTGSFLERIAGLFEIPVSSLGDSAKHSGKKIDISSTCVVFAESEIISLINRKISREDILMAVHRSVAQRIRNLLGGIKWQAPVSLTGGVAHNTALRQALAEELNRTIQVAEKPFFTGALGAALFAGDEILDKI